MGVAIAAAERHVKDSYVVGVDIATDQVPLGESVGKDRVVDQGEAPAGSTFRWPSGVVPKLGAEIAGAVGYTIHPDPTLLVIEAQTDGPNLNELFMTLLERLPSGDNLEVRVLDHFETTGVTDVWLTSRVDTKRIIRFLDDHDSELIDNGNIELSVYVRKHKATLRLTEHKTIVWLAEDNALEADVTGWLRELGVPRVDPLVTVTDVPHFHYRPAKSRDRAKLSEHLYRQRLRKVDKVKSEA